MIFIPKKKAPYQSSIILLSEMKQEFVKAYFGIVLNCQWYIQFAVWATQPIKRSIMPYGILWSLQGEAHKLYGPSVEYREGYTAWYIHNKLHRDDGPALVYGDDIYYWYCYGENHREDGPAIVIRSQYKAWYVNGRLHRKNGPARIHQNGKSEWWIDGRKQGVHFSVIE